jgi:hypothetical protein
VSSITFTLFDVSRCGGHPHDGVAAVAVQSDVVTSAPTTRHVYQAYSAAIPSYGSGKSRRGWDMPASSPNSPPRIASRLMASS